MLEENHSCGIETTFYFESFGVRIGLESVENIDLREFIHKFRIALQHSFKEIKKESVEYLFQIRINRESSFELVKNEKIFHTTNSLESALELLDTQIRVTIAEFAVGKVFLHSGVVSWKGKAIIIPGKSFFGKTTLVSALVKKGALYFSDEYAVLDENGFVHPFPKMLSLRGIIDDFRQIDVEVETLGGNISNIELPVGMVLIAEYQPEAKWEPIQLSSGEGIMELIPHTIPIRNNPKFALNVLNNVVNRAIISKTQRGEAEVFADIILNFFETRAF